MTQEFLRFFQENKCLLGTYFLIVLALFIGVALLVQINVCILQDDGIESGCTKKMISNVGNMSTPDTHYLEFIGINTNLRIFTKEGV